MPQCRRCKQSGVFLELNSHGHCEECARIMRARHRARMQAEAEGARRPEPEPPAREHRQSKAPEKHGPISCLVGVACIALLVILFARACSSSSDYAEELFALSEQTGLTVECLQVLETLAVHSGAELDDVIGTAQETARQMQESPEIFAAIGVPIVEEDGTPRSVQDVYLDVLYFYADGDLREVIDEVRHSADPLSEETLRNMIKMRG